MAVMGYNAVGNIEAVCRLEVVDVPAPITKHLDFDHLIEEYIAGESVNSLSLRYRVSRKAISDTLRRRGVHVRNRSESELLKWDRMTPEQRSGQVAAAHASVIGRKFPGRGKGRIAALESRLKLAATVEAKGLGMTSTERELAQMLRERGLVVIPQQAIGIYNCDLGAYPVAVEVFGGGWHFYGRHRARAPERFRYLFDAGWHVLILVVTNRYPLRAEAADYITAFHKLARSDPTSVRQYRMIRGAAELIASASAEDQDLPVIPALASGRDALGRCTTVAS